MLWRDFLRALGDRLTWRYAWRNAGRNHRRTAIVITATAVGVGGILIAMAINFGMIFEMVDAAIETGIGDLQVHGRGFEDKPALEVRITPEEGVDKRLVAGIPGVRAWAPRVLGEGLVFSPRASVGVRVLGVDPAREARVSVLASSIVEGGWLDGEARRLVMGERLARRLQVGVGGKVVLSSQALNGDMVGEAFRVCGLFRTSSRALDEGAVLMRLGESQSLLGLGQDFSELVLRAEPGADLAFLKRRLGERLPHDLEVKSWREVEPILVAMIGMYDKIGWVVYAAVFVAMAFGIANVLLMAVYERIREIGILTAIGMTPARLVAGVAVESLLLTLAGVAAGFALGLGSVWLLRGGIDLSAWSEGLQAYGIPTRIRPVIRSTDLVVPVVVALVTALLASLWPALRAVRIRPAEALRHV